MKFAQIDEPAATSLLPDREAGAALLAVRLAGAPFSPPYDLRSTAFEHLLEAKSRLFQEISELKEILLSEIFAMIPGTSDRTTRRRLLDVRRRLFNDRPLETKDIEVSENLTGLLQRYGEIKSREVDLFVAGRTRVLSEIRAQLRQVWEHPQFRLACRYASPDLVEDLERKGFPAEGELTSAERGLYSFLSRWTSKANPFHLFAEVAFPPSARISMDGDHELVLHAADLLAHERRLLARTGDPSRLRIQLRTFQRQGDSLVFWVPAAAGFQLVALSIGEPFLRETVDFFARRQGAPTGTVAEWREHIAAHSSANDLGLAEDCLEGFCRQGAVQRFMIADLDQFAPDLQGSEQDGELARLQSLHLARLTSAELASASASFPRLDSGEGEERSAVRYYVNSYRHLETGPFEAAAGLLRSSLQALKPFFARSHNFERQAFVIRSYFLDYLARKGSDRAPYLEILRHFLRHYREIIPRYQPETCLPAAERYRREERAARLAGLTGRLDAAALRDLEPDSHSAPSLCFNGPFDFVERTFYITNVFAGDRRFVSRYLLHRRRDAVAPGAGEEIHAELAVPPETNLHYVVHRFPAGCGFEARYAHRFERWIDPSEILIERAEDGIAYRDAVSGRPLRLHYRGFLLAHLLPTEYQLLLIGHADTFHNPFLPPAETLLGEGYDPGLFFGPICLRRESWKLDAGFWGDLLAEKDSLRLAARLRERVHVRLKPEDLWYYHGLGGGQAKPRLLDLRNPLSVLALQHAISTSPPESAVAMSAMQPPPPHLYHRDGEPVVTELMIEV